MPVFKVMLLLACLVCPSLEDSTTCTSTRAQFEQVKGADCVRSDFTRMISGSCNPLSCSLICAKTPKCMAFSLPDGVCLCKLFLFDECSHRVQSEEANCTHLVTVYVRSLAAVPAGQLCPPGFGFGRFGSSYKVSASAALNWTDALAQCGRESGLSKFADALDSDESRHLMWIKNVSNVPIESLFLGGHQIPGSANKALGWIWDACNVSIRTDVWEAGRPNAGLPDQGCANSFASHSLGIDDFKCSGSMKYVCQCLHVF